METGGEDGADYVGFQDEQTLKENALGIHTNERVGSMPPGDCARLGNQNSIPATSSGRAVGGYETRNPQYHECNERKGTIPHSIARCFHGSGLENWVFVGGLM